jgi:hypothetical protein
MAGMQRFLRIAVLTFFGGLAGALISGQAVNAALGPGLKSESDSRRTLRLVVSVAGMCAGAISAAVVYDFSSQRR